MTAPEHDNVEWKRLADFAWTEQAFEELKGGQLRADVIISDGVVSTRVWGACPRCDGFLDDRQVHTAVTNMLNGGARGLDVIAEQAPALVPVDVSCGCGEVHAGAADGVTGCGVSFRVELEAMVPESNSGGGSDDHGEIAVTP